MQSEGIAIILEPLEGTGVQLEPSEGTGILFKASEGICALGKSQHYTIDGSNDPGLASVIV